jgi:O-antigen ligase
MSTRAIHLLMELECIKASPLYGHGAGEYITVMRQALQAAPEQTEEIRVWASPENDPPKLNLFTGFAVSYGCIGTVLFLAWFALPTIVLWVKRWPTISFEQGCVVVALGTFILCPMMSASMEIFCYMLLATVPLLWVTDSTEEGSV